MTSNYVELYILLQIVPCKISFVCFLFSAFSPVVVSESDREKSGLQQ